MQQTRIEITDRLRHEGRWQEACEYRTECRLKAKNEGLGRQEANERAWKDMTEAYPPLSQWQIDYYPALCWWVLGEFPNKDSAFDDDEQEWGRVWRGICAAIAVLHPKCRRSPIARFKITEQIVSVIGEEQSDYELRQILLQVLAAPFEFLKTTAMQKILVMLKRTDRFNEADQAFLLSLLDSFERMTPETVDEIIANRLG